MSSPSGADGCTSKHAASHDRTSAGSTPTSPASQVRKSPATGSPRPHTGVRCCCLLRSRPAVVMSRSRWMASWGTRSTARSERKSSWRTEPSPARTATRPARPRSRSSHELTSAPPYTSTPNWRNPASPVSGRGRIRRLGESVWAPIIRRGASGAVAPAQAISDPSRTTNDGSAPLPADGSAPLPADGSAPLPADGSAPLHDSVGSRSMNPASASIRRADSAAWCGVGDASMNSARRRAGAGTLMVGSSSEGTDRFRIGGASRTGAVLRRSRIFSCVSRRCDPNWCSLNFLDRGYSLQTVRTPDPGGIPTGTGSIDGLEGTEAPGIGQQ